MSSGNKGHRAFARLLATAAAIGASILAAPPPAWAHNEVVATSPQDGGTVPALPATLSVTFSEQLDPSQTQIAVTLSGSVVDGLPAPAVDGNRIEQQLGAAAVPGQYVLAYRVVSTDGHPVSGTLDFTVDVPVQAPVTATPPPSTAPAVPDPATPQPPTSVEAAADGEDGDNGHRRALITAGIGLAAVLGLAAAGTVLATRRNRSRR